MIFKHKKNKKNLKIYDLKITKVYINTNLGIRILLIKFNNKKSKVVARIFSDLFIFFIVCIYTFLYVVTYILNDSFKSKKI